jgi:hypothetical protein
MDSDSIFAEFEDPSTPVAVRKFKFPQEDRRGHGIAQTNRGYRMLAPE